MTASVDSEVSSLSFSSPALPVDGWAETVLQVLPRLGDGGVEQSAVEMAHWLNKQGIDTGVASAAGSKVTRLAEAHVRHHDLPLSHKSPWGILLNAWRLRRLIRQHSYTLVHARSRAPAWAAWLATRGLRINGKPVGYLTTFHGTYSHGTMIKRWYNRVMLRAPVVIANSAFIKAHLTTVYGYPADDIVVAPRGIDPARYQTEDYPALKALLRQELALADQVPVVLMVGRLARWKGQHVLLQALKILAQDHPDLGWVALVVGSGDDKTGGTGAYARELQEMAADPMLQGRVRLLGSRSDVPVLLSLTTVAVSASTRAEAFGRVAVEAQAMGVPVIATALGGSLETVRDTAGAAGLAHGTGFLVAPEEPHILAEKLHFILTHPGEAARLSANARAWVTARFTVDACCTQEAKAYRILRCRLD